MSKLILLVISLFLISNGFAQRDYKGYVLEPCTDAIGIASKDNLSAFWSYETNSLLGELEEGLFQYYPRTKCLLKMTQGDSIYCYDLRFDSPKLIFTGHQEVFVDVLTESLIIYKGKRYNLGPEEYQDESETSGIISGAFGVELIDESVIIIDYKNSEPPGMVPLLDDFGNHITYFDSVTGVENFAYVAPKEVDLGYTKGGVRDRISKKWIIEPGAKWVIKGHSTYVAESIDYTLGSAQVMEERLYTIYDHQGRVLTQNLNESQILTTPEYRNRLVPKYKSDSILHPSEIRALLLWGNYSFVSGGKTGRFRLLTNEILHEPVDFLQWSSPIERTVHAAIENDSITFDIIDQVESYSIHKGDKFEFYSVPGGRLASLTFRVKKAAFDSVFTYQYRYANVVDTIAKEDFESSDLRFALAPAADNNRSVRLNQLWQFSIERIDNDQIIVTNNKAKFMGAEARFNSGVFSLKTHRWIIQPVYHSIVESETGFKAYLLGPSKDGTKFELFNFQGKAISP